MTFITRLFAIALSLSVLAPFVRAEPAGVDHATQNLCADDSLNSEAKQSLEADSCPECAAKANAKSAGLTPLTSQLSQLQAAVSQVGEDSVTRSKREIAFIRFLQARLNDSDWSWGDPVKPEPETLAEYVAAADQLNEEIESERQSVSESKENLAAAHKARAALDQYPESALPDHALKTMDKLFAAEVEEIEEKKLRFAKMMKQIQFHIDKFAKANKPVPKEFIHPSGKKMPSLLTQMENVKKMIARRDAEIKAVKNLQAKMRNPALAEEEEREEVKERLVEMAQGQVNLLTQTTPASEDHLNTLVERLSRYKARIAELKAEIPKVDTAAAEAAEIADFEKRAEKKIYQVSSNPGYRTCGLSTSEILALRLYSGSAYAPLNRALREGKADSVKPYTDVLNSALKKLKPYRGPVQRGSDLTPEIAARYEEGAIVTYPGFTSTSIGGGFSGNHKFIVESLNGRFIAPYSGVYPEYEVLFPAGARFKVLSRKSEQGQTEIVLQEVEP